MLVSCKTQSFFGSPLELNAHSENALIVSSLFSSDDCNVDATCDTSSLPLQQRSVVQLTHPLAHTFCSGTLIKGPGDKVYVLSARHCIATLNVNIVYPWSSYGVLFNFRLPCGASRVDNITATFSDFLQGLSVVFQDVNSDVAVFELLQDIPPEWNVMLAGWDASNVLNNFTWTDVSHPAGDSQKIATGMCVESVSTLVVGSVDVSNDTGCASPHCGYFDSILYGGSIQAGSSGSGIVHDDLHRVVGVLSSGEGEDCAHAEDPYSHEGPVATSGRLARAWVSGLYHLFDGATVDQPGSAEYTNYSPPLPTLSIGNIVPEVNPILGPAAISIQLQQAPQHTTTVEIASMDKTLISVSPLICDLHRQQLEHAAVCQPDCRGIVRSSMHGSSFFNPVVVASVPYKAHGSISKFNPQAPFITFDNGPFLPSVYLSYAPSVAEGKSQNQYQRSGMAYYIVVYPAASFVVPGTSDHFQGDFLVKMKPLAVEKVMAALDRSAQVPSINSVPYEAYGSPSPTGQMFYFSPPLSTRVDISTCFNATTVATAVSLLDGDTLLPISDSGEGCGTLLDQPVERGKAYLVLVTTPPTSVSLSRKPSMILMNLDISSGAPGAGMGFGAVDDADITTVANLKVRDVGDGPALKLALAPPKP
ncbi:hypothetical protein F751_0460 [Auxenochlorella protothecoides]|uniref:Peptidase S1 domain-containing protein n=1 Tax=Auxenochlorella protothecoides TaxID=3075 RepID=A0A087SAB0_AUXPR|nr:hypothetical protein F751_0460 [Auxenochlorella protothecoides]KFM22664.1 hypothetical protein F751_0460 [Auxenochlorella protothecoides]